jgi:DNA sulfur modification protein DndD
VIFDEIILHNFGVYGGRHTLQLTPLPGKPVVLIGGLNGGGKTTLLDAIHLSLYGKRARCSNRGTIPYEEYLRRSIHRGPEQGDGAAIEVQFRQRTEGAEQVYRIHRSWSAASNGATEKVEVIRNGTLDRVLTDSWAELVEELIPVGISQLFFFDGEKIEGFADFENSTELLSRAIHSLLGLDLVDRLSTDLIVLERRKQTAMKNDIERRQIEDAKAEVERLEQLRAELVAKRASAKNVVDRQEYELHKIEERFRREGGDLFERREQLEGERSATAKQLQDSEDKLRDVAEGPAPLLLMSNLLNAIDRQDQEEENAAQAEAVAHVLSERDARLLEKASAYGVSEAILTSLSNFLGEDRKQRAAATETDQFLNLSAEGRAHLKTLHTMLLPDVQKQLSELLERAHETRILLEDVERKIAGVPNHSAIAHLIEERQQVQGTIMETRALLSNADLQLVAVSRELDQKKAWLAAQIEKVVEAEFEQEDATRIIIHSQRARDTLDKFRIAVVERHVNRIEQFILESFQQLLRKKSLITDLKIHPKQFSLELVGAHGHILSPDRLSAGERQLLAVSILWGLARASGRALPTVIDTPLGRLDSSHRSNLVERYFPYASHQVLLLSTDQEIDETYYKKIKPWVGRSYRLEFNESQNATEVQSGYFW